MHSDGSLHQPTRGSHLQGLIRQEEAARAETVKLQSAMICSQLHHVGCELGGCQTGGKWEKKGVGMTGRQRDRPSSQGRRPTEEVGFVP